MSLLALPSFGGRVRASCLVAFSAFALVVPSLMSQTTTAEGTVTLPAFTVSKRSEARYTATESLSAARVRGSLMDLPASITVLTSEFLQDRGLGRLFDATRYVAGVSEGRSSNFQDRQVIRGFESNFVTVDNFSSIQQLNTNEFLIDRVEVVKGPSAILAPNGAPGGSISLITKVPSYETSRTLSAVVGWSNAQRVNLDMSGAIAPDSPWAYRLLASYQDGYLNREGGYNQGKLISGGLSYKISETTLLTVRGTYDYRKQYDPITVAVSSDSIDGADAKLGAGFDWTGSRNGNESWAHRGGPYASGDMLLTSTLGNHISMRFAAKTQYNEQDDESLVLSVPSLANRYNPTTGVQTPDYTWASNGAGGYVSTYSPYYDPTRLIRSPSAPNQWTEAYGAQFDVAANYRFPRISSTTGAGVAWDRVLINRKVLGGPNLPAFNLYEPVYGASPVFNTVTQKTASESRNLQYYLNERVGLLNDRVYLTGGLVRVDSNRHSADLLRNTASDLDDAKNLGSYGVILRPIPVLSLYGSFSENAVPTIANNVPLWQEGKQYEFGAKWSAFNNRVTFTAAHFQIAQTNVVVPNPAYVTDKTVPDSLISNIKDHGYEFEVQGDVTANLAMIASFSTLDIRDSLGRPVRAISPRNAALFLNYQFSDGALKGLSVFGGASYTGRRPGEVPSPNFTAAGVPTQVSYYLSPMTLVNVGATYRYNSRLTFTLNVDNLFNEKYLISTARANINTGDPMNIRLTTAYKF